jgi:hypothetical protein
LPLNDLIRRNFLCLKSEIAYSLIPDTSLQEIKFVNERVPESIIGLLILSFSLVWRAQLTIIAQSTKTIIEIQQLPSMKYIASAIMTKDKVVASILAGFAIAKSAILDVETYSGLDPEERKNFIETLIQELLADQTVTPKILNEKQISGEKEKLKHRKGLMSKSRGKWQAMPVFTPNSILTGSFSLALLSFSNFYNIFESQFESGNKPESDLYKLYRRSKCPILRFEFPPDKENKKYNESYAGYIITMHVTHFTLKTREFPDGITLSASKTENHLPLEEPFKNLLERSRPATPIKIPKELGDSFISLASPVKEEKSEKGSAPVERPNPPPAGSKKQTKTVQIRLNRKRNFKGN